MLCLIHNRDNSLDRSLLHQYNNNSNKCSNTINEEIILLITTIIPSGIMIAFTITITTETIILSVDPLTNNTNNNNNKNSSNNHSILLLQFQINQLIQTKSLKTNKPLIMSSNDQVQHQNKKVAKKLSILVVEMDRFILINQNKCL